MRMMKTMRVVSASTLAQTLALATLVTVSAFMSARAAETTFPLEGASVESGASKAAICGACHGANGNSVNPEWPNLAGQSAVYTEHQLRLFKENVRNSPVMQPIVATLNEADFKDVAVYFASQTPQGLEADPSYWKSGEQLYKRGDKTRNIPACVSCHGPIGRGNLAAGYPALRAQHSVYTVKQLNDYASDKRYPGATKEKPASPNAGIMATIAKRLTPEEIRDVSSYLQGMR
jgi:cytochrome c553